MTLLEEVRSEYKRQVDEHYDENRVAALEIGNLLEASPLNYNGVFDKTVHIPKVYDQATIDRFQKIAGITYRIFSKTIDEYRSNPEFRALFPFSKELEELILLPIPYESRLPIARFDLFYYEDTGDFKFCEINTDGTAAMVRDLEYRKVLDRNPAHRAVSAIYDLEPFEVFDSWVETFLRIYSTYSKKVDHPNVAIVDIMANATTGDFDEFQRRFLAAGVDCEIVDIRDLKYRYGALWSPSGKKVDAIYRRAVTADIMDHYEECADFIAAAKDDAVFFAGSFATQVIHTKWLFYVLHHPMSKAFLTEEEQDFVAKHVPLTLELSEEYISLEEVRANKDKYMLKPMDAYASKGVYASGRECTQEEWDRVTGELYGTGMICQEYCEQYLTENIDFAWGDGQWHPYINMPGLYTYDGVFHGFLMRMAADGKIIVAHENERTVPVFVVKGRK